MRKIYSFLIALFAVCGGANAQIDWTSSAEEPMSVPDVIQKTSQLEKNAMSDQKVYVVGVISKIKYTFSAQYGTATFWISDDGTEDEQFQCYSTYYLGDRAWVEGDTQIQVGDDVIVYGFVTNYNGDTPEFASKKNCLFELNGERGVAEEIPEYTKIADLKDDATATHVKVIYKASEILVTFVNSNNLYVTDGTDAMLLYGKNSDIKAGDKVSFDAKGELYLYNGLTEIAVSEYENLTVASSDNEITIPKVTIADVTNNYYKYENVLVTIEGLTPTDEAWDSNRRVVFTDESDNEIVVRDNFSVATELTFNKETPYTVTGFIARYKTEEADEYRIFPRAAADIDNGKEPEPFVAEGEGTLEKPYTIKDVKGILANEIAQEGAVWVHGFIVASANGSIDKLVFEGGEEAIVSNLMLGETKDDTDKSTMIPVELANQTKFRELFNLKDNPDKLGMEIWFCGSIERYFKVAGLKSLKDFSLDGKTHVSDLSADAADQTIYNLAGQQMQNTDRSGIYIVGKKKVVVK